MKKFHFIFAALFMFVIIGAGFSQDLPDQPGGKFTPTNIGESSEGKTPTVSEKHSNNPSYTDEYGEVNSNRILTGLNASGNYVNVPHNNLFNENFDGTVEFWINPASYISGGSGVLTKSQTFFIGLNTGGNPFFRIGSTLFAATSTIVPLNTWSHLAFVWTGGPTNFSVAFYMNGALLTTVGPLAATYDLNTNAVRIGGSEQFASNFFNGQIDEVRFWSSIRTLAEIRDNRFTGLGDGAGANTAAALTSASPYSGLVASWTFNGSSTTTVWEDINSQNGTYTGAANSVIAIAGQPIPYNFALQCPFGGNDYVTVPSNAAFNLSSAGSFDAWVNPTVQSTTHMITSRGTTGFELFWGVRFSIQNRQVLCINNTQFANSDGVTIPANTWSHVAVTWTQSGGNYTVTFYVNGIQSGASVTQPATWSSNSGTLRLGGWHGGAANNFNGYLDEVRMWSSALNFTQVAAYMNNSSRAGTMAGLVAAYNFDGNLISFGSTAGIAGSFNTGGTNNCRISAFTNENTSGAPSTSFNNHSTVVNRNVSPNPFVGGFAMKTSFRKINDLTVTRDTIVIPNAGSVTSVELFLNIQHTFAGDLEVTLRAPNGTTRNITSDNGGTGENVLTFFVDGAPNSVTNANFFPPWSNIAAPQVAMGNFGGSPTNGMWILEVNDDAGGDTGRVRSWGIRLNGSVTGLEPISTITPSKFSLYQNYPNPFNPVTKIKFDIPKANNVRLVVFDILGREVRTLVNEFTQPGTFEVAFDGSALASGTYFLRIEAGDFTDIKKMILVK